MKTAILATSRSWHEPMVQRLRERTGADVILIRDRTSLNRDHLERLKPRYVFFPHWSHTIPADVYGAFECVIFHMTDLPFGRGGSPLQNLIARGIYQTKISALKCVQQIDAGPIYLKRDLSLHGAAEEIMLRASRIVEDMIVDILANRPLPVPQEGTPTVFKRRRPEDSNMGQLTTLDQVFDHIRMLDAEGYPPAYLEIGNLRLEFSRGARKHGSVTADVKITDKE